MRPYITKDPQEDNTYYYFVYEDDEGERSKDYLGNAEKIRKAVEHYKQCEKA